MNLTSNVENKDLKSFGMILGVGITVIFGLFWPWVAGNVFPGEYPWWPWFCLLCVGGLAITFPEILKPVYIIWMRLGLILGWINTKLIMSILFFFIFVPIGLFIRMTGGDLLSKKLDKKRDTYRIPSKSINPNNLEKPY